MHFRKVHVEQPKSLRRECLVNKVIRQTVFHLLDLILDHLPRYSSTVRMHISSRSPPPKLLRDRPQPPKHIRKPLLQHRLALRLLLPKLQPTLRTPMLVPRRPTRRRVLQRQRRRPQTFPDHAETIIPREQAQFLLVRDDEAAFRVDHRVLSFARCRWASSDDGIGLLHDLKVRYTPQRAEVQFVRKRHREVSVLDGEAHELSQHGYHRAEESLVAAQLCQPHEPRYERTVRCYRLRVRDCGRLVSHRGGCDGGGCYGAGEEVGHCGEGEYRRRGLSVDVLGYYV